MFGCGDSFCHLNCPVPADYSLVLLIAQLKLQYNFPCREGCCWLFRLPSSFQPEWQQFVVLRVRLHSKEDKQTSLDARINAVSLAAETALSSLWCCHSGLKMPGGLKAILPWLYGSKWHEYWRRVLCHLNWNEGERCKAARPIHLVRLEIRRIESEIDLMTILRCFLSFKSVVMLSFV
jgi:hypothetical protein